MLLYVDNGLADQLGIIVKGSQGRIAIETEDAPDPPSVMVVINLGSRTLQTDGARPTLSIDEGLYLNRTNAVLLP